MLHFQQWKAADPVWELHFRLPKTIGARKFTMDIFMVFFEGCPYFEIAAISAVKSWQSVLELFESDIHGYFLRHTSTFVIL